MLKTVIRITGITLLLVVAAAVFLFLFQPRIPLGPATGLFSTLFTFLSGYEKKISGRYYLVPGIWTTLSVENGAVSLSGKDQLRIDATAEAGRITVHLPSLFAREISLDGIMVQGMDIGLHTGGGQGDDHRNTDGEATAQAVLAPFKLKQTGEIDLADMTASLTFPGIESEVNFHLVKAGGSFSRSAPGRLFVEGVLNSGILKVRAEGGPMAALESQEQEWPFSLHLDHKSISGDFGGTIAARETSIDFSLEGEHFDDLVSVAGLRGSTGRPFAFQGRMTLAQDDIYCDFSRVQLGSNILTLSSAVQKYNAEAPQYAIAIRGDRLDLDRLKYFLSGEEIDADHSGNSKKRIITRSDIILPEAFPVQNLAFELDFGEIVMAGRRAGDLHLAGKIIDGNIEESPFAVTLANSSPAGHFSLIYEDGIPHFYIKYATSLFDIGSFLRNAGLADDIVMHVDDSSAELRTRGRSIGELLNSLEYNLRATTGRYDYLDPNTGAVLPVFLDSATITGAPGEKTTASIQGKVGVTPLSMLIEAADRRQLPREEQDVAVSVAIRLADTEWELAGKIPLPFRKEGAVLKSRLTGERLSSLNELLRVQLPELGPYEIRGELSIVPEGYRLDNLMVRTGSSLLQGEAAVDTRTDLPEIRMDLDAHRIQLEDFRDLLSSPGPVSEGQEKMRDREAGKERKMYSLTDQAVLNRYNASLRVKVKEVLSGEEKLGSGILNIEQQRGGFRIEPLEILLSDGRIVVNLSVSPADHARLYNVAMQMENFDYGLMARWLKPGTDMEGIITLNASLESMSQNRQDVLANGSGYLDFWIQPRKMRAGVLDLWAVNLFSYLIPVLTNNNESTVNCAAGRFNLHEGNLNQEEFIIDTSQIRVKGEVNINFKTGKIGAWLRPLPKRPQFYSLSTPVRIDGTLADLDAGITAGGLIGTVIRLATSYVIVPMQWITQNRMPEDGTADCIKMIEGRVQ